jgi:hypothetical protein
MLRAISLHSSKFKKEVTCCFLNVDGSNGSGTDRMAVSYSNELYFDPLYIPPPRIILADYKTAPFRIQNHLYGHCGDYCLLWLNDLQHRTLDELYQLFTPMAALI